MEREMENGERREEQTRRKKESLEGIREGQ